MIEGQGSSIDLWQHAVALGLVIVDIVARGARSTALIPVSLVKAMIVNCCGDALAAITPARAGGDPVRYVWFVRSGVPGPLVMASFATETVVNGVVLGVGAIALLVFFTSTMWTMMQRALVGAATDDNLKIAAAAVGVGVVIAIAVARRFPHVWRRAASFLVESWRAFRTQPRSAVGRATAWTVLSMVARIAILPALLASTPGIPVGPMILGATLTLYALLLAPTPGGVGAIEAGFFAGFHDAMDAGHIATLLIAWRAYAWMASAAVGAVLLLWERWHR